MTATIIQAAIRKGLTWLATRGKGVSKHVGNHTRKASNLAVKNPRFAARALGRSAHSMFADPRPKKLIQKVLEKSDNAIMQSNGRVLVEKEFNRVIGKANERIVRVIIDSRTGRIITAFPVSAFATAGTALAASPPQAAETFIAATYDERLLETIEGVEKLAQEWERTKPKPREDVWTFLIDLLLDPTPAGDPDETLHVRVHNYVSSQADLMIRDLEFEFSHPLPAPSKAVLRKQFFDAIVGADIDADDEY